MCKIHKLVSIYMNQNVFSLKKFIPILLGNYNTNIINLNKYIFTIAVYVKILLW